MQCAVDDKYDDKQVQGALWFLKLISYASFWKCFLFMKKVCLRMYLRDFNMGLVIKWKKIIKKSLKIPEIEIS